MHVNEKANLGNHYYLAWWVGGGRLVVVSFRSAALPPLHAPISLHAHTLSPPPPLNSLNPHTATSHAVLNQPQTSNASFNWRSMVRCPFLFLLLLLLPVLHAAAAAAPQHPPRQHQAELHALVHRLLGPAKAPTFLAQVAFEFLPPPNTTTTSTDVFELESSASSNSLPLIIRGSSPLALATGLGWYLKHYCHAYVGSWDNRGHAQTSGRQLETINVSALPRLPRKRRVWALVPWRYYMNVCTVSYSMAWWDWARWEEELDWMALSGINLALAYTAQEFLWLKLFLALGLKRQDLTHDFFAGPAFLAWGRMGNIQKWGGPLSYEGWIEPQFRLQQRILGRMNALGITPVLPGFAGFVPPAFVRLFPNASVSQLPDWNGFGHHHNMSQVYLLEPTDPLFAELGRRFVALQQEAYGPDTTHFFGVDTFNEQDPRTADPTYLKLAAHSVLAGLRAADPQATWVMQGWLFHSSFWTDEALAAYLSGVPAEEEGALLVLDLNANQAGPSQVWPRLVRNEKHFVYSLLHNYGGRRALYGDLPALWTQPRADLARAGEWAVGLGLAMEAIEHNPVVYELMLERAWVVAEEEGGNETLGGWVDAYAQRRYSTAHPAFRQAWRLLTQAVYNVSEEGSYALMSPITREPRLGLELDRWTNASMLEEAWGRLLEGAAAVGAESRDWQTPLGYDLVDVSRQVLANVFAEAFVTFQSLYHQVLACSPEQEMQRRLLLRALRGVAARMLGVVDDTDELLASNANFLLGTWLQDARRWGRIKEEQDLCERNARYQVTRWGPRETRVNDYASKQWAGLVRDYHRQRWSMWLSACLAAAEAGKEVDEAAYQDQVWAFGEAWCNGTGGSYRVRPSGQDTLRLAQALWWKYVGMGEGSAVKQRTAVAM